MTLAEISIQGSLPTVAPVNPYTEFALVYKRMFGFISIEVHYLLNIYNNVTLRANWRPSRTAFLKGSVSFFKSALAFLRAERRSSKIVGKSPFRWWTFTNFANVINDI